MKQIIKIILLAAAAIILGLTLGYFLVFWESGRQAERLAEYCQAGEDRFWPLQAVDTMKYSRDLAREKLADAAFDAVIAEQAAAIARLGATHLAVGTPYDQEFVPFLRRWVEAGREQGLNIWFRGNLSGWEGWFGYAPISRIEHIAGIRNFIVNNPDLFAAGDIFDPCPECENGGPGDPRQHPDLEAYRRFLIDGTNSAAAGFNGIGQAVLTGYSSMNYDVARLVMNPATTAALGGLITVDHYVSSGEKLALDIAEISRLGQGRTVLGEFGFPIPDIHGPADEAEQARWLEEALDNLLALSSLSGINYWTSVGGLTALFNYDASAKPAAAVLEKYYSPRMVCGRILDESGRPVKNARISAFGREYAGNRRGFFRLLLPDKESVRIGFAADSYISLDLAYPADLAAGTVILQKAK